MGQLAWQYDEEYEDHEITEITGDKDGWVYVAAGWLNFGIPVGDNEPPRVGDTVRLWGGGFGFQIRGWALLRDDGTTLVYKYLTPDELQDENRKWVEEQKLKKVAEFQVARKARDRAVEALPEAFRLRIKHFQNIGGIEFRASHEPYEVFVCQEAVKIADTLKTVQAVGRFKNLSWEKQKEAVPEISNDHSGNTFDSAVMLAYFYLNGTNPERLVSDYGALSPLVGSYRKDS